MISVKSKLLKILYIFLSIIILVIYSSNIFANEIEGAGLCSEERFNKGKLYNTMVLRVLNQDTPVFNQVKDKTSVKNLDFGHVLSLTDKVLIENNRIYVKDYSEGDEIGWVNRSDLLCGNRARNSENGLTARILVRTKDKAYTNISDRIQKLSISQRNDKMKCAGECQKLSRFTGYFIFAKKKAKDCTRISKTSCYKYLISNKLELKGDDVLVGWIGSDNLFEWNNGYGLRVAESFVGEDKFVCGYKTLEEAKIDNKKNCFAKISGGTAWYERENRILMLDKKSDGNGGNIFKVIAPMRQDGYVDISAEKAKAIGNLRRLDIMFLIDGTNSMTTSMEAVKETMNNLVDRLPKGVQYRFAFQIYRDAYAKDKNLGDYYAFSNSCDINKNNLAIENNKFIEKLKNSVNTSKNDKGEGDKDPEENLFGGMKEAVMSLRGNCPDHTKILFVIGDTGYSALNQKKYDQPQINMESLIDLIKGNAQFDSNEGKNLEQGKSKPIISFFLQIENKKPNDARYVNAYKLFTRQAENFTNNILNDVKQRFSKLNIKQNIENKNYIYPITEEKLVDQILTQIRQIARPTLFSEYETRKSNGEASNEAINNMIGDPRYGNILGIVIDQILLSECSSIKKCEEQKKDVIREFYIKDFPEMITDIWMQPKNLKLFVNDMIEVKRTLAQTKTRDKKRNAIKTVLGRVLEAKLGYSPYENSEVSIAELYRKVNIAVPEDSPLFSIKFKDFDNLDQCVIDNISDWISAYTSFMKIIESNERSLPICGISSTDEVVSGKKTTILGVKTIDEAVKYFPPRCGRSNDEIESIKQAIAENCKVGENKQQLNKLISLKPPFDSSFRLPETMSIKHCSGLCEENDAANMIWVPKVMLP